MAKKSRTKGRSAAAAQATPGEVGPRQPCPCGSGKRYKACHGAPGGADDVFVARPFEGLPGECDLIAMRELVPAATARVRVKDRDEFVQLCTLLPMAVPAMKRESGQVWVGLQVQHHFGDPSRDLAAVLQEALDAEEPGLIGLTDPPGPGPRLQDLLEGDTFEVEVHEGFDFWVADMDATEALDSSLEAANESANPTARLTSVEAAYWTNVGTKEHLRWVMPEPEGALLDALARLHVSGADVIVPEARLVGMFRAHGLLVPVWDLPVGTGAEALEEPAAAFRTALDEALADTSDLTSEQRAARNGLANRQVTIR